MKTVDHDLNKALQDLVGMVNRQIGEGWIPLGGVSVSVIGLGVVEAPMSIVCQAMTFDMADDPT